MLFTGVLSLENNGGFASIRSQWTDYNLGAFDGIALRVRGDGNSYRFRIRSQETGPDIAYTTLFETEAGTWQEIYIPFSEMVPLYRGYVVNAAGPLNPESIRSFGLMLADKQTGEFSLEVDWINAVMVARSEIRYAGIAADASNSFSFSANRAPNHSSTNSSWEHSI
jgi:monofunctional biosynthetic peptidoglycan transglycosylase